ncbi:MAG: YncE family protein [Thermoplasmata archaeon]
MGRPHSVAVGVTFIVLALVSLIATSEGLSVGAVVHPLYGNGMGRGSEAVGVSAPSWGDCTVICPASTIPVGTWPSAVAVDPLNGNVYVANLGSSTLSVISGSTNYVVDTIPLPPAFGPQELTVNVVTGDLLVTGTCLGPGACPGSPVGVVSGLTESYLMTLSSNQSSGWGLAVDTATGAVYSTGPGIYEFANGTWSSTSAVVELARGTYAVDKSITLPAEAVGMIYDPANSDIYTGSPWSSYGPGNVSVISTATNSELSSFALPGNSSEFEFVLNSLSGDLYVVTAGIGIGSSDAVTVVSGSVNASTLTVPMNLTGGFQAAFDPTNGRLYLSDPDSGVVAVLAVLGDRIAPVASVPAPPGQLAVDSLNGDVFVANTSSNSVSEISGASNEVVFTVPVGLHPSAMVFDATNGRLYVVNEQSGTVTVIPTLVPSFHSVSWVVMLAFGSAPPAVLIALAVRGIRRR